MIEEQAGAFDDEEEPLETVYVYQDGARFYLFTSPKCDQRSVHSIMTWAGKVPDGDMQAAAEARKWFLESACLHCGLNPIWEESL